MQNGLGQPRRGYRRHVSTPQLGPCSRDTKHLPSIFFIISAVTELALGRHRKKEQRFGPSPANNYTSGYGNRFGSLFKRRGTVKTVEDPNALPMHTDPNQLRQSYTTDVTHVDGAGATTSTGYPKYGEAGYNEHGVPPAAPMGATTNGFGNVPGHGPPTGRYGDGTYNV